MVEVCKTNVRGRHDSMAMLNILKQKFPELIMNFDLEDCDRILRIEGDPIFITAIISEMKLKDFICEPLH
ncbi:hypothetical protein [Niabella soli]|uniref:Uncharacterized protein n=1 Tax=Niabella soli DSM 19437 TaxID=929713 RepID=W0F082_9BACT|nr:hypothetical protein [Niabella soli]AHF14741.1 hypothetical protein NIASO_05170 [Niabella soli DSM 19437]